VAKGKVTVDGLEGPFEDEPPPILAAKYWVSNADLIADVAKLGYLKKADVVLDPTYGKGIWWKKWRPERLFHHDLSNGPEYDFRNLEMYTDGFFDAIAFDPPYVSVGGRSTSGMKDMYEAFGLMDAPTTPLLVQSLINDGLDEMHRLVKPRGIVLVKCQDYISSGKLWPGTHYTLTHALAIGFELLDRLEHLSKASRAQPSGRRQMHARRNLSTMFVLRKGR